MKTLLAKLLALFKSDAVAEEKKVLAAVKGELSKVEAELKAEESKLSAEAKAYGLSLLARLSALLK